MTAPRDNLIRTVPFEITRSQQTEDGLTLEGYAAVFDSPTEIDSWEGRFRETIKHGAFTRSLNRRMPVLMFNHGQHPLIGDMPLGVIQHAKEDRRGLFIRARLATNWLIEPVREAVASGAVDGMSIRMKVIGETWHKPTTSDGIPERDITEINCAECGPVVFPAYTDTTVGVRSREVLNLLRDPEVRTDLARAVLLTRNDIADDGELPDVADEPDETEEPPETPEAEVQSDEDTTPEPLVETDTDQGPGSTTPDLTSDVTPSQPEDAVMARFRRQLIARKLGV